MVERVRTKKKRDVTMLKTSGLLRCESKRLLEYLPNMNKLPIFKKVTLMQINESNGIGQMSPVIYKWDYYVPKSVIH